MAISLPGGKVVLDAGLRQLAGWGIEPPSVCTGGLFVLSMSGLPDTWPDIAAVVRATGFAPDPAFEGILYAGRIDHLDPPAPPAEGLVVARRMCDYVPSFVAGIGGESIGMFDVGSDVTDGGALPALAGWADPWNLWVDERHRLRGVGLWLVPFAVPCLRLAGCDKMLVTVAVDSERAGRGVSTSASAWSASPGSNGPGRGPPQPRPAPVIRSARQLSGVTSPVTAASWVSKALCTHRPSLGRLRALLAASEELGELGGCERSVLVVFGRDRPAVEMFGFLRAAAFLGEVVGEAHHRRRGVIGMAALDGSLVGDSGEVVVPVGTEDGSAVLVGESEGLQQLVDSGSAVPSAIADRDGHEDCDKAQHDEQLHPDAQFRCHRETGHGASEHQVTTVWAEREHAPRVRLEALVAPRSRHDVLEPLSTASASCV